MPGTVPPALPELTPLVLTPIPGDRHYYYYYYYYSEEEEEWWWGSIPILQMGRLRH